MAPTWCGWSRSPTRSSWSPMSPRSLPARASAGRSPSSTRRSDAAAPAPARARRRHRPALGDEADRRPLGPAPGRGRVSRRRACGRPGGLPPRSRVDPGRPRGLPRAARPADPRCPARPGRGSAAELARRLASHRHVARSTTPACPTTRSTSAPRACCRMGRGRCCHSRSPGASSRPRRSWPAAPGDPRHQSRGRRVADRAARALRRRRLDRRPHAVSPVGRHQNVEDLWADLDAALGAAFA